MDGPFFQEFNMLTIVALQKDGNQWQLVVADDVEGESIVQDINETSAEFWKSKAVPVETVPA